MNDTSNASLPPLDPPLQNLIGSTDDANYYRYHRDAVVYDSGNCARKL